MITRVAIKTATEIFTMPKPYRHHDIIHRVNRTHPGVLYGSHVVQGFTDDKITFMDRIDAAKHALACGQIESLMSPPELYSEDLW